MTVTRRKDDWKMILLQNKNIKGYLKYDFGFHIYKIFNEDFVCIYQLIREDLKNYILISVFAESYL